VVFDCEVTDNTEYDFKIVDTDELEYINEGPILFGVVEDKPLFNRGSPANKETSL
jgi:hypothetical protein